MKTDVNNVVHYIAVLIIKHIHEADIRWKLSDWFRPVMETASTTGRHQI